MVNAPAFSGMNNVSSRIRETFSTPSLIFNAQVEPDGSVKKRNGYSLFAALPNAHSLWTNNKGVVLCSANGKIYKVKDFQTFTELSDTQASDAPISYIEIGGLIYMSNQYWARIYNPKDDTVISWGDDVPSQPVVYEVTGNLTAGRYFICATKTNSYGRITGNSPITKITFSENKGFTIANYSPDNIYWVTNPDGSTFYCAGNVQAITDPITSNEPIPSLWGQPPNPMTHTTWAFGRVWGIDANNTSRIVYSEPFQPELFKPHASFIDLGEENEAYMLAKSTSGLYVGCKQRTFFFSGRQPDEMIQVEVEGGVIPGTLCYASDLGELGRNVPVWLSKKGVCVGTIDGQVIDVLKERVRIDPKQIQGASICRVKDGRKQMLFSMQHATTDSGQAVSIGDKVMCEVVRNGTIIDK